MNFESLAEIRGRVSFPEHTGERIYMKRFNKPEELGRWAPTVAAMLYGVLYDHAFLMVDQGIVVDGKPLRRPGVHIDGWWNDGSQDHGHPEPGHGHPHIKAHGQPPYDPPTPGHGHTPNPRPMHITTGREEGIFLASDKAGCLFYTGKFAGPIGEGGDCSHINLLRLDQQVMLPGQCYAGNVTMLHESVAIQTGPRTLVRVNVPGWRPQ